MSKNHCDNKSSCCNDNCYNSCNSYGNSGLDFGGSWFYIMAILLIFGSGGSGPGSFWGGYDNIFRCSGFNNGWCNNTSNNPLNNGNFNTTTSNNNNNNNNNFSGNNLSNSSTSTNTDLAALLGSLFGGLSTNTNSDINNITDSSN